METRSEIGSGSSHLRVTVKYQGITFYSTFVLIYGQAASGSANRGHSSVRLISFCKTQQLIENLNELFQS